MDMNGVFTFPDVVYDKYWQIDATPIIKWEVVEQSREGNYSNFKIELYFVTNGSQYWESSFVLTSDGSISVNGVRANFNDTPGGTVVEYGEFLVFGSTLKVPHNEDGTLTDVKINVSVRNLFTRNNYKTLNATIPEINPIERNITITSAPNFTDNDSSVPVNYYNPSPGLIDSAEICISLDESGEAYIPYRSINVNGSIYTFNFTYQEIELLQQAAKDTDNITVWFCIKSYMLGSVFYSMFPRNLTIVGIYPVLNPTVKDIKLETLELTGNENTFIRYESMAEYSINATPSKYATIVKQQIKCGSKIIEDLPNGIIQDVESGDFEFYVLDSRNMATSSTVFKNLIEYVKPTCYQEAQIELSGDISAAIKLTTSGNYYNGSFGMENNEFMLEVRYGEQYGELGDWIKISSTPTFKNNTYTVSNNFSGFDYGKAYVFESRLRDKLNVVQSTQYVIKLLPVFDWGEGDFNFNVPININADELSMHEETIIRHSNDTNNTVLSATGGHIYLRPGGTSNTGSETIFYSDGSVKFNGDVIFADGSIGGANSLNIADYIIETGESEMGTNGTWKWAKWASGKAECWGCRNYGNMAVTTTWGNLYRSAIFTQDLPNKLFARTPDVININLVSVGYGGWICKHEQTAPSAITTGSFIVTRPASATLTTSYIGFHIIGEW